MCRINWSVLVATIVFSLFLVSGLLLSGQLLSGTSQVLAALGVIVAAIAIACILGARHGDRESRYES